MSLAYLDPGSGSLIASVLVGGAAAAGVAAKQARARLMRLGRRRKGEELEVQAEDEATTAEAADAGAEPSDAAATRDG
ncbi:MAG: hypothetical protein C0P77_002330 [Thermoanaerobacterales bacterium]|mgnify:FL=1|jgi:hypothetical protein|nr:hypothetical protein [Thermoanaerobacterales bacterium]